MDMDFELIEVTQENVDKKGFFCYMSKKKTEGYRRKMEWVKQRLAEGMQIKILTGGSRGFIEYIPGEYAWRALHAEGYMVIHCHWIVGKKNMGRGHGSFLLDLCENDAREQGMKGVAVLASDRVWLAGKELYLKKGYEIVQEEPPFLLLVKKFKKAENPRLAGGWEKKAAACGGGITVFRSAQCPYIADAVNTMKEIAGRHGKPFKEINLENRDMVVEQAPSPYGVFSIVEDSKLLSYHYLLAKDYDKLVADE